MHDGRAIEHREAIELLGLDARDVPDPGPLQHRAVIARASGLGQNAPQPVATERGQLGRRAPLGGAGCHTGPGQRPGRAQNVKKSWSSWSAVCEGHATGLAADG